MSQTVISVFVMLLAELLPKLGLNIGGDQLTSTVQTIVIIGGGIWIWIRRYQAGGITAAGVRTV